MSTARVWPDQEPELLHLLPLVYVAWSDLELDDQEIEAIREAAGCQQADSGVCAALGSWLDPGQPPSAGELARIQRWVRSGTVQAQAPSTVRTVLEDALGLSVEAARKAQLAAPYVTRGQLPRRLSPGSTWPRLRICSTAPTPRNANGCVLSLKNRCLPTPWDSPQTSNANKCCAGLFA
ncbi:MAG: hypothetical protein AAGA48_37270 [Myxococcota bacterium]